MNIKENKKTIRILHCNNDNKNKGGAYLVERKLEPYIRKYGYIFDYFTMDEFIDSGNKNTDPLPDSKLFSARLRKNKVLGHIRLPFSFIKVLKANPYKLVHIDIDSAWKALLYAIPAKIIGTKVLVHSHATGIDGHFKSLKRLFHIICKFLLNMFTDKYIACSSKALAWLCPKFEMNNSEILINGINANEFYYKETIRKACRKNLKIENKNFVLCNVGRICENKNQIFLLDVLVDLKKTISDVKLLLVGPYDSEYLSKLKKLVKEKKIEDSVIIENETSDVNRFLNAADFFLLPSHFEGFSLVSLEAQITGLKCILSTGVPLETKVTENVEFAELKQGPKVWAENIKKRMLIIEERNTKHLDERYSLEGMAKHLASIYETMDIRK